MSEWVDSPADRADVMEVKEAVENLAVPRRERIATVVLVGLLAHPGRYIPKPDEQRAQAHLVAAIAVEYADALIAALDE